MSKQGLAPYIENFVWESPSDIYSHQHESNKSQEDKDYPADSSDKNLNDETIHQFIDQFCVKQIKKRVPLKDLMNRIEKVILTKVLSRFNGNQKAASQFLRIKNTTLHEKMKRHKVSFAKTAH